MLSTLFSNGFSAETVYMLLSSLFVVFCTLPIHEAAHAFAAHKLGDDTAKYAGRLTLDPFRHLDLVGSILIVLFGFGWAKPVPINPDNFKNPKRGMALSALAGPVSNLLVAMVLMLIYHGIIAFFGVNYYVAVIAQFLFNAAWINVSLAVFNLIPVPPLDGSRLLSALLPDRQYYKLMQYEQYLMIAVIALIATGVLDVPLSFMSGWLMDGVSYIAALPFSFM